MARRFADLAALTGARIGLLPSGPTSSVHDVPGVGLGHVTFALDDAPHPDGVGTVRTGVSALHLPGDLFGSPVPAGGAVLNGAGECTGFVTLTEWGRVETPVLLTATMLVGRVYDAVCRVLAARDPRVGVDDVLIPVVAECDDSGLSDPRWFRPTDDDVARALDAAREAAGSGAAAEVGCVGAGTGMECLGFKGGIGSASRVLPDGHVLGAVVLTNFGSGERLSVCGVPLGHLVADAATPRRPAPSPSSASRPDSPRPDRPQPDRGDRGSCIVVLVTDAPLDAQACGRLARRAGLGLARVGSVATHGSGEIFLALATGLRGDRVRAADVAPLFGRDLDPFFAAAVEVTEEAVVTSLLAATTTTGRDGRTVEALPFDGVVDALRAGLRS